MNAVQQFVTLLGRILLSGIFLMSGIHKITAWESTMQSMQNEGMTNVPILLGAAVFAEIAGGLSLLLGLWGRIGAFGLFVFLIPTTLIFHDFWTYEDQQRMQQMMHFMKNLTIMGGLLIVTAFGTGDWSITRRKPDKSE